jgi:hypothetical protein
MDLQAAHAAYWFSKDTIQVRIAAVFVSLSENTTAGLIRLRCDRASGASFFRWGGRLCRADRFKGL